jgi:DNA-binding NarL/FixJ family response regulator
MVKGLSSVPGVRVLATCSHGEEVVRLVKSHHPDVLLLDTEIPGDAMRILTELSAARLESRIVLLAAHLDERHMLEAMRLGAMGVVLKSMPLRLIVQCVRKVYRGERWIERASLGRAIDQLLRDEENCRNLGAFLSAREIEVTRLAAKGWSNKDIGQKLGISEGTVKVHLHRIYGKLRVKGRLELALFARDRGLFSTLLTEPARRCFG